MKLKARKRKILPPWNKNLVEIDINDVLNSCIQIETPTVSRRNIIPQQICFNLNLEILGKIEQVRAKNIRLTLSPANLVDLQCCVLLNCPIENISSNQIDYSSQFSTLRRSSLTFSTNYSLSINQQPKTLFRSSIDLKGAISQQIQQDLWQDRLLLTRVSQAHYWLIAEILAQLPLKGEAQSWLAPSLSLIVASIVTIIFWRFLSLNILFELSVFLGIFFIFYFIFEKFLVKNIRNFMVYNLVNNPSFKSIRIKRLELKILKIMN